MTTILAIDTSSIACSVALSHEGRVVDDHQLVPRQHNALVLGMIDELFRSMNAEPAQLQGVVYGRGPGSFTGVRIAAAIAQGLALAQDVPTIGVSSLQSMARSALVDHVAPGVIATLASRPGEIYLGAFDVVAGECVLLGEELVGKAGDLAFPEALDRVDLDDWLIVGEAAELLDDRWGERRPRFVRNVWPRASAALHIGADLFKAGLGGDENIAIPIYLQAGQPWRKSTT